jgi:hypothetical protein
MFHVEHDRRYLEPNTQWYSLVYLLTACMTLSALMSVIYVLPESQLNLQWIVIKLAQSDLKILRRLNAVKVSCLPALS